MKSLKLHSDPLAGQLKGLIGVIFIAIVLAGLILLPR
jgi:hypothetical protein